MNTLAQDPIALAYHELCSPLALVATAARTLLEDNCSEFARARCEAIERTAERLLRTARFILHVASGGELPDPIELGPAAVVEDVTSDFRALGLPIRLEVESELTSFIALMPASPFEILLQSILSNARDHGEPGSPVGLGMSLLDDGRMAISVSNHVSVARSHEGLGVGVHFCRRLADLLAIEFDSFLAGDGYEVRLLIPGLAARPPRVQVNAVQARSGDDRNFAELAQVGPRVLVAAR